MQRVHFQVRVGVFKLSTNLDKDFCRYLWYCGNKNQIECRLAWHWLNSTDLGLIDKFLCRNCCLYIIIQKIARQDESRKYFQIWFSPDLGEKNGGVLSMRMQVILDSLFARPGSAPIWCGKKREFRDWTSATSAKFFFCVFYGPRRSRSINSQKNEANIQ